MAMGTQEVSSKRDEKLTAGRTCTVEIDVADAVGVGFSLRSLASRGYPNAETAAIFERVANAMIEAAMRSKP